MGSQPPMPVRMPGRVAGAERGKVPRGERRGSRAASPPAGTYRSRTRVSPGRDSAALADGALVRCFTCSSLVGLQPGRGARRARLQPPRPRSVSAACGRLSLR